MRIKETFNLTISWLDWKYTVEVVNDGIEKFEDQAEGSMQHLIDYIRVQIDAGKRKGWTPYANFESSVHWRILPSKQEIEEYMELHNNDEVGENDPWDYEDAEYHLLLSDEYHHVNL